MNSLFALILTALAAQVCWGDDPYSYENHPYYSNEVVNYDTRWHTPAPKPLSLLRTFLEGSSILSERQFGPIPIGALLAVGGTAVSLGTTAAASSSLTDDINKVSARTDTARSKGSEVCAKVNEILNVAELTSTQTGIASVTNFQMTKALVDASATTLTSSATINGKSLANAQKSTLATTTGAISTDGSNIGVTAQDFETFRKAVNAADLALQAKIDEILKKTTLTC